MSAEGVTPARGVPVESALCGRRAGDCNEPCGAVRVQAAETEGRFALLEQSLIGLTRSVSSVETAAAHAAGRAEVTAAAAASSSKTTRLWIAGQALALLLGLLYGLLAMRDRLLTVELQQSSSREALGRVERQLDTIGSRLGVPPAPTPSP